MITMANPTAIPFPDKTAPTEAEPDAPLASQSISAPSVKTAAVQLFGAIAREATTPAVPNGTPPPVRALPAWLAVVLMVASNIGTAGAVVAGLGVDDSKRIGTLEAENAAQREKLDRVAKDVDALTKRAATSDERTGKIEEVVTQQEFDRVEEVRYLIALGTVSLDWLGVPEDERPAMSDRLGERYKDIEVSKTRRKLFGKPNRSGKVLE